MILLDDYHVRRGNDMAVRKPLIDFIQNQLAPADMVAIMYPLTPVDRSALHAGPRARSSARSSKFEGRKFNYPPRNKFEEQYAMLPGRVVERIRNQVAMDALKGAAVKMGGLREGRKSIIFVSEGLHDDAAAAAQRSDCVACRASTTRNRGRRERAAADRHADADGDDRPELATCSEVFTTANRQNTSIYAVDPRGLAVFEYGINEGGRPAAGRDGPAHERSTRCTRSPNNTDGRAIVNRNDLAAGMKQIMRDSSGYYLLGYNSTQAPTDGKFHGIKVSVKRRGASTSAPARAIGPTPPEDVARANATAPSRRRRRR